MSKTGIISTLALLAVLAPTRVQAQDGNVYRWVNYTCVPQEQSALTSFEIMNFRPTYGAPKVAELQRLAGWGWVHHDGAAPGQRFNVDFSGDARDLDTGALLHVFDGSNRLNRDATLDFFDPLPALPDDVDAAILDVRLSTNSSVLIDDCSVTVGVVPLLGSCTPGDTRLCLGKGGRFQAELDFQALDGSTQTAMAEQTGESDGFFWFSNTSQPEVIASVLDQCSGPAPAHAVSYEVRTPFPNRLILSDTKTGEVKVYVGPGGSPTAPTTDTEAFLGCP